MNGSFRAPAQMVTLTPMKFRTLMLSVAASLCLFAGGCSWFDGSGSTRTRTVRPSDFVGTPTTRPVTAKAASRTQGAETSRAAAGQSAEDAKLAQDLHDATARTDDNETGERAVEKALSKLPKPVVVAASRPATTRPEDEVYTLDAMVGQVNGQPMYAASVFEPISDQLAAIGRREPRVVFKLRAKELIAKRLDEMLLDSLILGEAERDLSPAEQAGLQNILKLQRQDIVRFWGEGSEKLADIRLREHQGKGVDQLMTERRQKIVVQRYLRQKLLPKINVTRKDIERYYSDHYKEYNPPAGRTLRILRAVSSDAADRVEKSLAEGTPFKDLAANSRLNRYLPDKGGLMEDTGGEEKLFGLEPLNEALAKLQPGQYSPRIKTGNNDWWIFYESRQEGKGRPLRDVQLDIEELLRSQRFRYLSARYQERLREQGSYNPLDEMADSLLEVAVSRYALPE